MQHPKLSPTSSSSNNLLDKYISCKKNYMKGNQTPFTNKEF